MARVVTGEYWAVTFGAYIPSQASNNTVHFKCQSHAGAGITDATLAAYFDTPSAVVYKGFMGTSATFYGTKVVRADPRPIAIPYVTNANSGVAAGGGTIVPTAVAYILRLQSDLIGRSGRGRLYLPFMANTFQQAGLGEPTIAIGIILQVWATALFVGPQTIVSGADTSVMTPVIFNKAIPSGSVPITSALAVGKWATLHKRGDYGKTNSPPPLSP